MYRVIRWVLFRLEPERAHRVTIRAMKILQAWLEFRWFVAVLWELVKQEAGRRRR